MAFYKLREWVGTVTGKGDRWGRDRLGRSAPAFLSANTTALPPSTYLHGERQADVGLQLLFRCEAGHLWPFVLRPVPDGESAGCVLPAEPSLPAIPTAFNSLPPFKFALPFILLCLPCSIPCAPGSSCRYKCLQATRLSRRQQQRGSAVAARAPYCVQYTVAGAAHRFTYNLNEIFIKKILV